MPSANRYVLLKCPVIALLGALLVQSAKSALTIGARFADDQSVAVGVQYDSTHVYVATADIESFVKSLIATLGGTAQTLSQSSFSVFRAAKGWQTTWKRMREGSGALARSIDVSASHRHLERCGCW